MRRRFSLVLLIAAVIFYARPSAAQVETQPAHSHDGGFMQGGMHHSVALGVKLDARSDAATHTITLRIGPMNLPANTSHMKMPQPADLLWTIPLTGWLLAYHPRLVDSAGNSVAGTVLHHVAFWNENRSDFLCPNKEEHIFGAGGELTDWALIPGFGYRVEKGDQIRIETMIHNPTPVSYPDAYLEISIPYTDDASPAPLKDFYPAWMDVASCGNSAYDLPAGPSQKTGSVSLKAPGVLLGVGGHMHDYAKQITLESQSPSSPSAPKTQVAVLPAKSDAQGHLLGMPVVTFFQTGGYPLAAGQKLTITAAYDNPTGKLLRDGAMGIVVGYFVPSDPAAFDSLRHPASAPPPHAHSHEHMSHEH